MCKRWDTPEKPLRELGRNNGDKTGGLSIGLAEMASGKCLLLPDDHIIPNNLTMPQHLLTAVAMNVVRVIAWLRGKLLEERRRKPGHFARLAPYPLSRQAVLC
jgi:hypothetical protein